MRDEEHIEPEEARRILTEETPRRLELLRRDLQNLKDFLLRQAQSTRESPVDREEQPA